MEGIFMAKGSGVLHYTGKRGGRGQPNKRLGG